MHFLIEEINTDRLTSAEDQYLFHTLQLIHHEILYFSVFYIVIELHEVL